MQPPRRGGDLFFTSAKICWRLVLASPLLQAGVSPAFPWRHPTVLGVLGAAPFPRSSDKSLREFWQRSTEDELGSAPNSWKYLQGRICFDKRSLASSFPSPQRVHRFSVPVKLLIQKDSTKSVLLVLPLTLHPCVPAKPCGSKFCQYITLNTQGPSQTSVLIQPHKTYNNRNPAASLKEMTPSNVEENSCGLIPFT